MILSDKDVGKLFWIECVVTNLEYIGPGKFVSLYYDPNTLDANDFNYWFVLPISPPQQHCFYESEVKYRLDNS